MTTACMTTTPPTVTHSLRLTIPKTGRGQARLWTAAAAPDHRLWTTLRGPVDPSRLPTCPLPRRRRRPPARHQITSIKGETTYSHAPVAKPALAHIDRPRQVGQT